MSHSNICSSSFKRRLRLKQRMGILSLSHAISREPKVDCRSSRAFTKAVPPIGESETPTCLRLLDIHRIRSRCHGKTLFGRQDTGGNTLAPRRIPFQDPSELFDGKGCKMENRQRPILKVFVIQVDSKCRAPEKRPPFPQPLRPFY